MLLWEKSVEDGENFTARYRVRPYGHDKFQRPHVAQFTSVKDTFAFATCWCFIALG
jgi:hypothetical protein